MFGGLADLEYELRRLHHEVRFGRYDVDPDERKLFHGRRSARRCGTCLYWHLPETARYIGSCRRPRFRSRWLGGVLRMKAYESDWCRKWVPDMSKL